MLIKVLFVLSLSIALIECAKLLRTPKVYNAIITTDEQLTPSRAFPVFQPVLQPALPVLSPFYPTSIIDPYSRNDVSEGRREVKNGQRAESKSDEVDHVDEPTNTNRAESDQPISSDPKPSNRRDEKPEGGKSPIPLNEYGFPPSLIPLQKYPSYPYASYPFIYDSYGNFQTIQYPVLPPAYYPQQEHSLPPIEQPMFHVGARKLDQDQPREEKSLQINENALPQPAQRNAIRNNGNTNADIPDSPIPPIPFSIKRD